MLRVSTRMHSGDQEGERTTMGTVAVAGELAGSDDLDELGKPTASQTEPEDENEDEGDGDEDEEFEPDDIPHG
jgi:hypothetical protein